MYLTIRDFLETVVSGAAGCGWISNSAGLGRAFFRRSGSRILRGCGVPFWLGDAETEWEMGMGVGGVGDRSELGVERVHLRAITRR